MKTKLLGFSIFLVMVLSLILPQSYGSAYASQGNSCYPPRAGLTGWWPGDGNTVDIVGGRNAVRHDNTAFVAGLVNQAFSLDGMGDFISVPHDPNDPALNLGTGDFTVDLWVYFNDTEGEQVLVEKWVQGFTKASLGWTLTKLDGNYLRLAMDDGTGEITIDSDALSIPSDTWTHFAATREIKPMGTKITLYMNGVPVATGSDLVNLDSPSSLKFGHRGNLNDTPGSEDDRDFYLNGRIDEVQLFVGRALPRGLIKAIFNAGSAGQCKD